MLHLISNPRIYRKLKDVIRQAVAAGVSSPITADEAGKIPYLRVSTANNSTSYPPDEHLC